MPHVVRQGRAHLSVAIRNQGRPPTLPCGSRGVLPLTAPMAKVRVIVISPNLFLREGVRRLLDDTTYEIVADAPALCRVAPVRDGMLIDLVIWSPGTTDDLEAEIAHARTLLSLTPSARPSGLAGHARRPCRVSVGCVGGRCDPILRHAERGLPAHARHRAHGAAGVSAVVAQVAAAAVASEAGLPAAPLPSSVASAEAVSEAGLTDREVQILNCLVSGSSNKSIARQLLVTEPTVKAHVKGLLRKIRVSNRTQAAIWALSQTRPAA